MENKSQKTPNIVAITQARMGSSRLPGKVLTQLLDRSLLDWHCTRMFECKLVDSYVVATTNLSGDKDIENFCLERAISCFRGDESDVFSRYLEVARQENADIIVRVTGDCPLIDPELVDETIDYFLSCGPDMDYVSLDISAYARGFDVEVFSRGALEKLSQLDLTRAEKEHVTLGLYGREGEFNCKNFAGFAGEERPENTYRLCVDEIADLNAVSALLNCFESGHINLSWKQILDKLAKHPEIVALNSHVEQVKVL